jgi:alpha-tubulin suppressor-like RCC1 family protein
MSRLLSLVLLCGCTGSLIDHGDASVSEAACRDTCTSAPAGAAPLCIGSTCTYECDGGKLKCATGCCAATALSAGTSHTCAVVAGEARCWGANNQGQLGRDLNRPGVTVTSSFAPVKPPLTGTVTTIAAGAEHTCAIVEGEVFCWGSNSFGQLGNGSSGPGTGGWTPQKVAGLAGAVLIAAGGGHTCAATTSPSQILCWGRNNSGQLGDGSNATRVAPTPVPGATAPYSIAAGDSHTCTATATSVFCWGLNDAGQLGNPAKPPDSWAPSPAWPPLSASFVGLGANHSCAGDSSGKLYCWGANGAFQVDNSREDRWEPREVLSNASAVAGGIGHTCAVRTNQEMRCWGLNDKGQLGSSTPTDDEVNVLMSGVQAVAAGYKHSCAIQDGATLCWGLNDRGQLGTDLATVSRGVPEPVTGR